jgi:cation:H+ antiporter
VGSRLRAGAAVLVRAGIVLARCGDEIATRTRLGGLLVGTLLMAAATSLPELVTVVSAAAAQAPNLAVGSVFGSSMGNMAILAVLDLVHRKHVWPSIELGHARVGSLAIALTALAVMGVVTPWGFTFGWVGFDTVLILVGWVAAVAWMRRSRGGRLTEFPTPTEWGEAEAPRGELAPLPCASVWPPWWCWWRGRLLRSLETDR